ncbi:uncharacterized protein M421DRAFT_1051 [Didymella exigua CBS 183.55]|uniref:Uncharacterized protein n=1 Tax=Didymella exigua CBS 183.55 TaxID=1150837 RepID=A0A6A5S0M1_9PLEO|nr:uncharacterized protein M421DRAFT_1051 [Didymella exigua CBS 183.55]KAF1933672.1 hypothetical protein M421DRAFT_1051 [Didymella exigua CBS 183.55]
MDNALVKFLTIVHLVWWPISKLITTVRILLSPLLRLVVFLLSPIWVVGSFLVLPFVHLVRGLYHIFTLPLQVKWLERIETLYIYLGTAGLIGCVTGAVLYFIFKFLSSSFNIDATSRSKPRKARTTTEFRAARREKQHQTLAPSPPISVVVDKARGRRGLGLLSQIIVEEEDSDF